MYTITYNKVCKFIPLRGILFVVLGFLVPILFLLHSSLSINTSSSQYSIHQHYLDYNNNYTNRSLKDISKNVTAIKFMYEKIIPCLKNNPIVESRFTPLRFTYPKDAEEHYQTLLQKTKPFREFRHHEFGGYNGPWVEVLFIERFIHKPLSYFNGIIPIFVQWIENDLATRVTDNGLFDVLRKELRQDVIYMLVSQSNGGIYQLADEFPNILMLSAGGFGHIPIPLVKGELSYLQIPPYFPIDAGFYGDEHHGGRQAIFEELDKYTADMIVRKGKSRTWIDDMYMLHNLYYMVLIIMSIIAFRGKTKYNLAPAGYGPTSFRLAEIVQIGRIPVHISNDRDWLPYQGTRAAIDQIGFVGSLPHIRELVTSLRRASEEDIALKLHLVADSRRLYTYDGLLDEIDKLFMADPFGSSSSLLRCERVPVLHSWGFWWGSLKKKLRRMVRT